MGFPKMIVSQILLLLLILVATCQGEPSYNHYPAARYYTPKTYNTYRDDNVYITDKYGNTVAVEPYWARSAQSQNYDSAPYYSTGCYNCVTSRSNVYDPYPYARKVYVKDSYGNSYLVNPSYSNNAYWRNYYSPSSRSGRYYFSDRKYSSNEDYVYVNDMYGRTRAVPKSSYLYEYAKGY